MHPCSCDRDEIDGRVVFSTDGPVTWHLAVLHRNGGALFELMTCVSGRSSSRRRVAAQHKVK